MGEVNEEVNGGTVRDGVGFVTVSNGDLEFPPFTGSLDLDRELHLMVETEEDDPFRGSPKLGLLDLKLILILFPSMITQNRTDVLMF